MINVTREFIILPEFEKCWKSIGLNDVDLKRLQSELLLSSQENPVMQGTGGLRKVRFAIENRGKSSSIRVVYVDFVIYETIYLISAYPKNEKDNLSKAERNSIKVLIQKLEAQLKMNKEVKRYECI